MSCTLRFNHAGWDVMTDSWTAGTYHGKQTEVHYVWNSGDKSAASVTLPLPFNTFAAYVEECQKSNVTADLRGENLKKVAQNYEALGRRPT